MAAPCLPNLSLTKIFLLHCVLRTVQLYYLSNTKEVLASTVVDYSCTSVPGTSTVCRVQYGGYTSVTVCPTPLELHARRPEPRGPRARRAAPGARARVPAIGWLPRRRRRDGVLLSPAHPVPSSAQLLSLEALFGTMPARWSSRQTCRAGWLDARQ